MMPLHRSITPTSSKADDNRKTLSQLQQPYSSEARVLPSQGYPETEEGSSWTVAVFACPRQNWTETLRDLYSLLDKQGLSLIPHYTIRAFNRQNDSLLISFRVLRKQENEGAIKSLLEEFMKIYPHEIDPEAGSSFSNAHAWIRHGAKDPKRSLENCQTLSKLSRFVLEIFKSDTTRDDKEEWTHLFSNMTAMFDIFRIYQSPETILNPDVTEYRALKY
jgi:hypothetical protein